MVAVKLIRLTLLFMTVSLVQEMCKGKADSDMIVPRDNKEQAISHLTSKAKNGCAPHLFVYASPGNC
jgi:hypothetical protein